MNIRNIIFDLGGVIIDVDYNLTTEAFRNLGMKNFDEIYSKKKQSPFFDNFEKGLISNDAFHEEVRKHIAHAVTDDEINAAWNAMLINVPESRFRWLDKIRNHYRIMLLSNTNRIHIKAFTKIIDGQFGAGRFDKLFDKIYYSCVIGMRKPDHEIFELVMQENQLEFSNTIFIDDSPQHIQGARNYGLTALHLENGFKVEEWLDDKIIALQNNN